MESAEARVMLTKDGEPVGRFQLEVLVFPGLGAVLH